MCVLARNYKHLPGKSTPEQLDGDQTVTECELDQREKLEVCVSVPSSGCIVLLSVMVDYMHYQE